MSVYIDSERNRFGRMMAGHVSMTVSDIYALPDPANLGRVLAVTQSIIEEIEALAPGAFSMPAKMRIVA